MAAAGDVAEACNAATCCPWHYRPAGPRTHKPHSAPFCHIHALQFDTVAVRRTAGLCSVPAALPWVPQAKRVLLALAEPTGHASALAMGSAHPAAACAKYVFTARPATGAAVTSPLLPAPAHVFSTLAAGTRYTVSMACISARGARVPGTNTLALATPAAK